MGSIYPRGGILWVAYVDEYGERRLRTTTLPIGQEAKAQKALDVIERQVAAARAAGVSAGSGPLTVAGYLKVWSAERMQRDLSNWDKDEIRLRLHALPMLGRMELDKVRPSHIKALVLRLKSKMGSGKSDMAPRTVLHVYGLLRTMFRSAAEEELIQANPCVLSKKYLPKKQDKDPTWRSSAVFSRSEVEQLISDERIPEERRVLYALLFITGMRINEAAARRWRDYDATVEPLGRLSVATSYNRRKAKLKGLKTDVPREVPVHPVLAKMLAAWKLGGWERQNGHPPREDDLLVPSGRGQYLRDPVVLRSLRADLRTLGLRSRTVHNIRRTFISLTRAAKADKEIIRTVTHGRSGDQLDDYTTYPWEDVCGEVAKLRVALNEGRLIPMKLAACGEGDTMGLLQSVLQSKSETEIPSLVPVVAGQNQDGRGGTRTPYIGGQRESEEAVSRNVPVAWLGPDVNGKQPSAIRCSNVAEALEALRAEWALTPKGNAAFLAALRQMLARLEGGK